MAFPGVSLFLLLLHSTLMLLSLVLTHTQLQQPDSAGANGGAQPRRGTLWSRRQVRLERLESLHSTGRRRCVGHLGDWASSLKTLSWPHAPANASTA